MSAQLGLAMDGPHETDADWTWGEPIPTGWYLRLSMALAASVDDVGPQPRYHDFWLKRLQACWVLARVRVFDRLNLSGARTWAGGDARSHAARLVRWARSVHMRTEAA